MALLASPDVGVRGRPLLKNFSVLVAPLARESFRSLDATLSVSPILCLASINLIASSLLVTRHLSLLRGV